MIKYGDRVRVKEGFFKGTEGHAIDYMDLLNGYTRIDVELYIPSYDAEHIKRLIIKSFDERNLEKI